MSRGQPFVVVGTVFLAVALATYATGESSAGATWLSVGLAMLAVGVGLWQADRRREPPREDTEQA